MGATATREDQQGTPGLVQRASNTSQRINPKAGPRPASSPMPSVLMGGSGLTGTLATLLGDPPHCPRYGKLKVISPRLAPCRTTSSSRIRHHSSAAVVALRLSATSILSSESVGSSTTFPGLSDHVHSSKPRGHIKEQLRQSTPLSPSLRVFCVCLLKRRKGAACVAFCCPFACGLERVGIGSSYEVENEERTGPAERN
jgi:hypothetical protein